jgi:hypothetical protein
VTREGDADYSIDLLIPGYFQGSYSFRKKNIRLLSLVIAPVITQAVDERGELVLLDSREADDVGCMAADDVEHQLFPVVPAIRAAGNRGRENVERYDLD